MLNAKTDVIRGKWLVREPRVYSLYALPGHICPAATFCSVAAVFRASLRVTVSALHIANSRDHQVRLCMDDPSGW